MSVEEIERYNVLADEIRKLGSELQTAEKSWEIAANRYYEAFQTEVRIEKALEGLASRQSALEDSLKHLHGKFALLNSRVAPIAQPKRKRERKGKK